jgi:anti-sigma factor RsiW
MGSDRTEALLIKYLLGDLTEEEQAAVEDRAFADAEYLGELRAAESDLIDSYVRGELPRSDRQRFESRFLTSPARRNKVEFARALATVAAESKQDEAPRATRSGWLMGWSPALQFAGALALLICVAGGAWLVLQNAGMRSRVTTLEAQHRESEQREKILRSQLEAQQTRSTPGQPVFALLMLAPGLSRAENRVEQLVLSPGAQIARIEIQLEPRDDYPRFRAELRTRGGEELMTRNSLRRQQSGAAYSVTLEIPASTLAAGEYEIALKAVPDKQPERDIGYYYFRVVKQ